nr:hypothetical protein [uncultured Dysosmobacter sp.]
MSMTDNELTIIRAEIEANLEKRRRKQGYSIEEGNRNELLKRVWRIYNRDPNLFRMALMNAASFIKQNLEQHDIS